MPATMRVAEARRRADADSPNAAIPTTPPPIAPFPVHTAYAVPIGIVFMAMARSHTLKAIPMAHTTSASGFLKPFDILSAVAQTTSNKPATISITQFIKSSSHFHDCFHKRVVLVDLAIEGALEIIEGYDVRDVLHGVERAARDEVYRFLELDACA